jgi:hypothetical protein
MVCRSFLAHKKYCDGRSRHTRNAEPPLAAGVLREFQAGASCATDPKSGGAGFANGSHGVQDRLERVAASACGSSEGLVASFVSKRFDAGFGLVVQGEVSVHDSLPFSSRVSPALMGSVSGFGLNKA